MLVSQVVIHGCQELIDDYANRRHNQRQMAKDYRDSLPSVANEVQNEVG
jgi:acetylglutamate kinase